MVKERFKNQVRDSRSYPSADIDSDHNLVMMKCIMKFKRLKKREGKIDWDIENLKNQDIAALYAKETDKITAQVHPDSINDEWEKIKSTIQKAAELFVGKAPKKSRKEWITTDIVNLIEERRKYKNLVSEEGKANYRRIRNLVNRETRKAREHFLDEKCREIEDDMRKGNTDAAYSKVSRYFKIRKTGNAGTVENKEGELLFGEDRGRRWKEYIEDLYGDEPLRADIMEREEDVDQDEMGDYILQEEFDRALIELRNKKAAGIDNIPAELLKKSGNKMKESLTQLIRNIYDTGEIPKDFQRGIIVPIPKKATARKCEQYRTLCLLSHASKIPARIVLKRMETKVEELLSEDQFGFRRGMGTREAIISLRLLIEKQMRKNKPTYIAFIDLEKAFDNVKWEVMFKILEKAGLKYRDRRIIHSLYKNEVAVIRSQTHSQEAHIRKGVRQGCALSPIIFNAYIQEAVEEIRERIETGVRVGGRRIDMLRYADDIVVVTEKEDDLANILNEMDRVLREQYHMKINVKKTKLMICSTDERPQQNLHIAIGDEDLEEVKEFTYLGSKITVDGRSKHEIISRIHQAKIAFNLKRNLLTNKNINIEIRKRFLKVYVWSVALYGCESWTIGERERKRLEAFETWCYRRILKVSWMDRMTNEEVYRRVGEKKCLWNSIQTRRDTLIGHILRRDHHIVKSIVEGMIEGRNPRGRPRLSYMPQIMRDMGCASFVDLKRKAENRMEWRAAANQPQG